MKIACSVQLGVERKDRCRISDVRCRLKQEQKQVRKLKEERQKRVKNSEKWNVER